MDLKLEVFYLNIKRVFNKVWHSEIIYKLKWNRIIDFLDARKQRVILNGQYSSWASVKAGVPQGPVLGPLFILTLLLTSLTT